jgi:hypothetical protein
LTAHVAFLADWEERRKGGCAGGSGGWWLNRERCRDQASRPGWDSWEGADGIYASVALVYGLAAGSVRMLTKATLPAAKDADDEADETSRESRTVPTQGPTLRDGDWKDHVHGCWK